MELKIPLSVAIPLAILILGLMRHMYLSANKRMEDALESIDKRLKEESEKAEKQEKEQEREMEVVKRDVALLKNDKENITKTLEDGLKSVNALIEELRKDIKSAFNLYYESQANLVSKEDCNRRHGK